MANDLKFGSEARMLIAEGIKKLEDAVKVTLGPQGKNVLIEQNFGSPLIVNDGATIAKNVILKDQYQNLGASLIVEAAIKTNDLAGDGTTTAVILASECILKGLSLLEEGINPLLIKEGFEYYTPIIIEKIKLKSKQISSIADLYQVASLSSGNNKIGKLIAEATNSVGINGEVRVEESQGLDTSVDIVKGYCYDRGYLSSYMINDEEKRIAVLDNPIVLIVDKKITSMKELVPFLENAMKLGKPLLIICDDIEQEVLSTIVMNKLRGVFNVVITKTPSFGDKKVKLLTDIKVATSASVVTDYQFEDPLKVLGHAKKIIVSSNKTIIISDGENNEQITSYVDMLQQQLLDTTSMYEKKSYQERIALLTGGIAVIKVGAPTEVELHDKLLRIEDALNATKAAKSSGIVDGGGKTFYEISEELEFVEEYKDAYNILKEVLKKPFFQILENSCIEKEEIMLKVNKNNWYDAKKKQIVPIEESGIIDPVNVEIAAITNAISVAGIVLTTECAIISLEDKPKVSEDNLL